MAIVKKWVEVEDECLGPTKTNAHWEMYLFIHLCVEYSRKTKHGLQKFIRRSRTLKTIEGKFKKNVLSQLEDYFAQSNVFLLP
ncbi:hypothetical protein LCGC14_0580870 [marine sediment metagenome]|uniref:Uncharacterized protein n=1 Tax=marine sediment metagenome TaxID=412755 RepID=A0A0F9RGH9_9ZZZZ